MNLSQKLGGLALAAFTAVAGAIGLTATRAEAQNTPTLNLCTGGATGNYAFAGEQIRQRAPGVTVTVIHTQGSWDNMQRMSRGECDAAIVQEDAVMHFSRTTNMGLVPVADLYGESLHMVCNRNSGVTELKDLMNSTKKIALGQPGSGPWVTWQNLVAADNSYGRVVTSPQSGALAASQVAQGLLDCMLIISGANSAALRDLDQRYGAQTRLIQVRDRDLERHRGMAGGRLYTRTEIAEGTYPNWTPNSMWSDNSVNTVQVTAKVVASDRLPDAQLNALLDGVDRSRAAIQARIEGRDQPTQPRR